ncbi:MAG TPA: DHH family phosphoesterase, partial [Candidatus Binataceae bacterium]|nr:DHH family phosphoesterase [Candidatus Binataceae bacterium]
MPMDWVIPPQWTGRSQLAATLRVSPVVAQVLHNRGISDAPAARDFFKPSAAGLHAPELLPGATRAAARIADAIGRNERIVLFGDYDVDGITGVAILWHILKLAGADPRVYIPHRLEEGYGINADAIDSLADDGAQLIVTVDCGITAIEPARRAKARGVELIITDHHAPATSADGQTTLPDAMLVHPLACDSATERYPNPSISGAGVALKLAWAVAQRISKSEKVLPEYRDLLWEAMSLAALGTIADVVPLLGENRIIATHGLAGLPKSRFVGIQALIESSGL